jgi:hypothetical protein
VSKDPLYCNDCLARLTKERTFLSLSSTNLKNYDGYNKRVKLRNDDSSSSDYENNLSSSQRSSSKGQVVSSKSVRPTFL